MKIRYLIILCIFFVSVGLYLELKNDNFFSPKLSYQNFQIDFNRINKRVDENIQLIKNEVDNNKSKKTIINLFQSFNQSGIGYYLFDKQNQLKYWSNNLVPFTNQILEYQNNTVLKLENGWYLLKNTQINDSKLVVFILLKQVYLYNNKYLKSGYGNYFNIDNKVKISLKKTAFPVKYFPSTEPLFYLDFSEFSSNNTSIYSDIAIYAYIIAFFFLLLMALYVARNFTLSRYYIGIIVIICLFVFRWLSIYYQWPRVWYLSDLFSPIYYASSAVHPSLGDLFINTLLVFFFVLMINKYIVIFAEHIHKPYLKNLIYSVFVLLYTTLVYYISYLISGVILNSTISFDVNYILGLSTLSLLGFTILIILFITHFMSLYMAVKMFLYLSDRIYMYLLCWLLSALVILFLHFSIDNIVIVVFVGIVWMMLFFILKRNKSINRFIHFLYFILIYSLIATFLLINQNQTKELSNQLMVASKLNVERDLVAEYSFKSIAEQIAKDSMVSNSVYQTAYSEQEIKDYIVETYFVDYVGMYDIQLTICRNQDYLLIRPRNFRQNCFDYFRDYIRTYGQKTLSDNLFYIDRGTGRASYIAKIALKKQGKNNGANVRIFVEMDAKFVPKGLGYPELLMDEKLAAQQDLKDYSYARYSKGLLIDQYGDFIYNDYLTTYQQKYDSIHMFEFQGYDHLVYPAEGDVVLIISKKKLEWMGYLTPFSYMLSLFVVITLFYLLFTKLLLEKDKIHFNLQSRIQITMISIILFSLFIVGAISIYHIVNMYNNKNKESIKEKMNSVLIEIQNKQNQDEEYYFESSIKNKELLLKLSNVFFTDINLYDIDGRLISSSRMEIFEEGLIGKQINSKAYGKLNLENSTMYVQEEKIGNLKYLSAYAPIKDVNNSIVAYINLPYFAKYNETKKEISGYTVTIVNIYIFLFAITIIAAYLITIYVTKPLYLVKEKIGHVKLGSKNEKLTWTSDDEIGALISEYNRMVDELELSAQLLSQSERETAWREMAKQVAHEIKNPLTPMKLNVQYLEKKLRDKPEDWPERLAKFSNTMIAQIETLSNIASAFSNFASMPEHKLQAVELCSFVEGIISLYYGSSVSVRADFSQLEQRTVFVQIDPSLMNQAMNNLIRNAIQAIPEYKKGEVIIRPIIQDNKVVLSVIDNGIGISEEMKDKIFMPNFTTKNSGMGLGLAMVKNIIESFDGNVYFETQINIGTTFNICLPIYLNKESIRVLT